MTSEQVARFDREAYTNISGELVRNLRVQRGYTVREFAAKAGISKTTLLRIEASEPVRIESLIRVCATLPAMPDQLKMPSDPLPDNPRVSIVRSKDNGFRVAFLMPGAPKTIRELTRVDDQKERSRLAKLKFASGFSQIFPNLIRGSELMAGIMEPHGPHGSKIYTGTPRKDHRHPGEEFIYCINGPANLIVDDVVYRLETGDAAYFDSGQAHNYGIADPIDHDNPPRLLAVWLERAWSEE